MRTTTPRYLGRLGNPDGVNVAQVEVTWYYEGKVGNDQVENGYYLVHATGDEPEIAEAGECGSIYTVFENRVHEAMEARKETLGFDAWEIEDISAA